MAYSLFRTYSDNGDCPYSPKRRKRRLVLFLLLMFIHIGVLIGGVVYGCHVFKTYKSDSFQNIHANESVNDFLSERIYIDGTSSEKITKWKNADKTGILLASIQIMQQHGVTQDEIMEMLTEKLGLTEEEAQLLLEQALEENSL